jgi:hypothetical protein
MTNQKLVLIFAFTTAAMCPQMARAQSRFPVDPSETINYAFDYFYGFGAYEVTDQRVTLLQVPVSFTLRSLEKYNWGIRLRLSGLVAIYDFTTIEEFEIEQIRSITIVPGIEFLFPTGSRSLLRPYLDIGAAKPEGGSAIPLSAAGVRWEYVTKWRRWEIGVEPRLQFGLARTDSEKDDEEFADVGAYLDARYPFWFRIGQHQPDWGVYFDTGWLFNELTFLTVTGDQHRIDQQYEIGVSLGFRDRAKIWFVTLPRIGVGYRFGGGLSGVRIRIGGNRMLRFPDASASEEIVR